MSLVSCLFGFHVYKEQWRSPRHRRRTVNSVHICACGRAHIFFIDKDNTKFLRHYTLIEKGIGWMRLRFYNPSESDTNLPAIVIINKQKNIVWMSAHQLFIDRKIKG